MKVKKWKKLKQTEFKGAYKTLLTKTFELPNGSVHEFDIWLNKNGWVGVLALTPELEVIASCSFRPGPEKVLYEPILGLIDDEDKSPMQCASRELLEETGYKAGRIVATASNVVTMPYTQGYGHYFVAFDCELEAAQDLDDAESIVVQKFALRDYVNNILRTGLTSHSSCVWAALDYLQGEGIITRDDIG